MVDEKVLGNPLFLPVLGLHKLSRGELAEELLEEAADEAAVVKGENGDIVPVLREMIENVGDHAAGTGGLAGKVVGFFPLRLQGKDVGEHLLADFLQQLVPGGKVGIEGRSADVGPVYDVLDRDARKILAGQQGGKGLQNGRSGLQLPAIPVYAVRHVVSAECLLPAPARRAVWTIPVLHGRSRRLEVHKTSQGQL